MLSILLSARKNSKFLSKMMFSLATKTADFSQVEILVMLNEHDSWNQDLVKYFSQTGLASFYTENTGKGRHALHEYFNSLAQKAQGDWLMYLCEDHDIVAEGYDQILRDFIARANLDPAGKHLLIPAFTNTGSVNHILSRGFYQAMGDFGHHGNLDSYFNDLASRLPPQMIFHPPEKLFVDYTCQPEIMTPQHSQIEGVERFFVPAFTPEYYQEIEKDVRRLCA